MSSLISGTGFYIIFVYPNYVLIFVPNNIQKKEHIMILANFSEFRSNLKDYLDRVEKDNETLFLKRASGAGSVVMSLEEYNSIMETLHLLKSRKNAERLFESMSQIESGDVVIKAKLTD